ENGSDPSRFIFLFREVLIFGAGIALPVAMFLTPYISSDSVSRFLYGVFVLPGKRFAYASMRPDSIGLVAGLIVDCLLMLIAFVFRVSKKLLWMALLAIPIVTGLARLSERIYRVQWSSIWMVLPITIIGGAFLLSRAGAAGSNPKQQQSTFLMLSVASSCAL